MDAEIANELAEKVREHHEWVVDLRREIHRRPELRFEEYETSARLQRELEGLGLEVRTGLAGTGVAAVLEGGGKSSGGLDVVALRADMDALPLTEATGLPFSSVNMGRMHACGHDAHSAMVAGIARIFAQSPKLRQALPGTLKFVFQPAEEGGMGARQMIQAGVLRDPEVQAILGIHVFPNLPTGKVSVYPRYSHASADSFKIELDGRGGHAGYPHLSVDPVSPLADILVALRTLVSRETDALDSAAISVGMIRCGETDNVVAENAVIQGTLRSLGEGLRDKLMRRIREVATNIAEAHRGRAEVHFHGECPANLNDARVTGAVAEECQEVVGGLSTLRLPPSMGAEDFGFFNQEVPGSMFRLGCSEPGNDDWFPLHSPHFVIDEECMALGAHILARTAFRLLERGIPEAA